MTYKKRMIMRQYSLISMVVAASAFALLLAAAMGDQPATAQIAPAASVQPLPDPCSLAVVQCEGESVSSGKASYYDYVLASGWSSKGHRVAASRDFKRGTMLRVTNKANGKSVDVLVTDFGPEAAKHPDRIIDLSSFAFSQLAPLSLGILDVTVSPL